MFLVIFGCYGILNTKILFRASFHRGIDQIKKLNSFDDCPFLLEFQKKESMPSFNYISARLNDGSSKLSH